MALLAIDVGNTNSVFGLSDPVATGPFRPVWRLSSVHERTADEWYALLAPLLANQVPATDAIADVAIATVVPAIGRALHDMADRRFGVKPLFVSASLDLGINVRADAPAEVGADRLANCAAAHAIMGGPVVVVDLGTATKIEAVTAAGDYLGGIIAPGLGLGLDALATRAARLYAVELRLPDDVIGRNTVAAVQSGVVAGHLAMIEGLVRQLQSRLGGDARVILTGGFATSLAGASPLFTDDIPDLVLRGIREIARRNRPR